MVSLTAMHKTDMTVYSDAFGLSHTFYIPKQADFGAHNFVQSSLFDKSATVFLLMSKLITSADSPVPSESAVSGHRPILFINGSSKRKFMKRHVNF